MTQIEQSPPEPPKPNNGQCPQCGKMHPPYHNDSFVAVYNAPRLVRCDHCSNAFFQDLEP